MTEKYSKVKIGQRIYFVLPNGGRLEVRLTSAEVRPAKEFFVGLTDASEDGTIPVTSVTRKRDIRKEESKVWRDEIEVQLRGLRIAENTSWLTWPAAGPTTIEN